MNPVIFVLFVAFVVTNMLICLSTYSLITLGTHVWAIKVCETFLNEKCMNYKFVKHGNRA